MRGHVHPKKDVDFFRITAAAEQLSLTAAPPSGLALSVELLDLKGIMVASSKQDAAFGKVQLKATVTKGQDYYLRVSSPGTNSPDHEYQMEMSREGP
jgi:hypothetical protein